KGPALQLTLRDGRCVVFRTLMDACSSMFAARVKRAIAASESDEEAAALLRPAGAVDASHVAQLRVLGAGEDASYREARVPRERLWRLVEDPGVDGATRARAAVALSGDAEGRERLRVVAEATASPKVRVALERTAEGHEDARVAEALAELEAEGE